MTYAVWCRVSGGVTGTREAWMKDANGIVRFATKDEAQTEADRLNKQMNGPYSRASFRYTVTEYHAY